MYLFFHRKATGMRSKLLLIIFYLIIGMAAGTGPPPPITEQTLQKVAGSLQMYIEPLLQMPKLYGYSIVKGWPKSVTLNIGMFEKKWVRIDTLLPCITQS